MLVTWKVVVGSDTLCKTRASYAARQRSDNENDSEPGFLHTRCMRTHPCDCSTSKCCCSHSCEICAMQKGLQLQNLIRTHEQARFRLRDKITDARWSGGIAYRGQQQLGPFRGILGVCGLVRSPQVCKNKRSMFCTHSVLHFAVLVVFLLGLVCIKKFFFYTIASAIDNVGKPCVIPEELF